ncbi:hypothetical protein [Micromonospora sp. NPDC002931]|uniref:hypothetical protein n=1 Tax=unclassified Micromonospora TaxID=2617518 RepID=UPI0036793F90
MAGPWAPAGDAGVSVTGTGSGAASGTASGVGCCGTAASNRAEAEGLRRMGITRPPAELPGRGSPSDAGRAAGSSGPAGPAVSRWTIGSQSGGRVDGPWDGPSGDQLG